MLNISHLSKTFETLKAVDDISFDVGEGEIFGFLGPNGAGKTTTISMIAGLLKPDSGKIQIDNMDLKTNIRKIKKIMGVVPQEIRRRK
jgi:ABC-2 type transport system ATP-binding protein